MKVGLNGGADCTDFRILPGITPDCDPRHKEHRLTVSACLPNTEVESTEVLYA